MINHKKNIKLLIAEDHTLVRKGIIELLKVHSDIEILDEVDNGIDAVKRANELKPDVIIMDLSLPLLNGLEATRQIKEKYPQVKILILTMHENEEYAFQILKAGASGYFVKKYDITDLIQAVYEVLKSDTFISPSISKERLDEYIKKAEDKNSEILTKREQEVLKLIVEGHKNNEIAKILNLSLKTIERHRRSIMTKLNIHDSASLIVYGIEREFINNIVKNE